MGLTHRDAITAAIVSYLAWGQTVHFIPLLRYIPYVFLAAIIFTLLLILCYDIYNTRQCESGRIRRTSSKLQMDIAIGFHRVFGAGESTCQKAIIAAIVLYILWGYAVDWVPVLRYIPLAFVAGIVVTLIIVGALTIYLMLFTCRGVLPHTTKSREQPQTPTFVGPEAWRKNISLLKTRPIYDPAVLYPPSFFISDALNGMVDLILRDYIRCWYVNICHSSSFPDEVDRILRVAVVNLRDRMLGVDFVDVTVKRCLPIITEHFRVCDRAERLVRGPKLNRKIMGSEELDWEIAREYREGKLHRAAHVASDTKPLRQGHLRDIIAQLLPDLLPEDVNGCRVVSVLLREVLACAVLFPLMQVLSEPDTWNQVIESYGRSMLHDRRSVRRLRAALDEHASPTLKAPAPMSPRKWRRNGSDNNMRRLAASSTDLKSTTQHMDTAAPQRHSFDSPPQRLLPGNDSEDDPLASQAHGLAVDQGIINQPGANQDRMVEAMEAALNDIIDDQPPPTTARGLGYDTRALVTSSVHDLTPSERQVGSSRARSLSSERKREKPSLVSLGLVNVSPGFSVFSDDDIFGEEEKLLEDEHGDLEGAAGEGDSADDIPQAAPGDLDLAEAIAALSSDIERLVVQESIVDRMIRKAELINNIAELRILNKSKLSLQRELQVKEGQRQQYIVQESDNNLYGRATVGITSVLLGRAEDGQEFALYVIEIQRKAGQQIPAASWTVGRRYREFHDLHQGLRAVYPAVRRLDFPRRRLVLKLQKNFLQRRRSSFEIYLRELLRMPEVCRSRDLRAFLSQRTMNPANDSKGEVDQKDRIKGIYDSPMDGMSEIIRNDDAVLDQVPAVVPTLTSAATDALSTSPQAEMKAPVSAAEGEAELNAFETRELEPFVKPICDILLEIFNLKRGQSWLRGRTVVVVLHQLLGGIVERKVRDYAQTLVQEESIIGYINLIKDSIWPAGRATPGEAKIRTEAQKTKSRKAARVVLATVIPDLAGNIVGKANAQAASRRISATLNNRRVTAHLAFTLLDELVQVLFGETRSR